MNLDLLAIAPHPDDVELHCGGLMLKMAALGYATGIVDMTRGEMGTRGTVEDRNTEAAAAAEILGLARRVNLNLPDTGIQSNPDQKRAVLEAIRTHRPELLLIPHPVARHPDHTAASHLAQDAAFLSGLSRVETGQPPWRPGQIIFYFTHYAYREIQPSFIVDISEHFSRKLDAIRTYRTQFHNPLSNEPTTYISRPEFLDELEAHNRSYGTLIGARYGEPFFIREYLSVADPVAFFKR
jgi:bacillithiol biosynthesis deacetylase BshB1